MINPCHECWNSRHTKTELIFDQCQLIGAGVSLRVLMHGLKDHNVVWFSAIYGMHHDNCIALGVAREESQALEKTIDESATPIRSAVRGDFEIEEYLLNQSVQSALGVVIQSYGAADELHEVGARYLRDDELHDEGIHGVRIRVDVHDDCFFTVQPAEGDTLRNLLHAILQQHSFYLQTEVNWEPVLDELAALLHRIPALELKSDPRRKSLTLTIKKRRVSMMDALFGRRPRYVVDVSTGTAHFLKRPLQE